jgi:hypothetical protein
MKFENAKLQAAAKHPKDSQMPHVPVPGHAKRMKNFTQYT